VNFNNHSDLKDLHAFLSPSNYHWLNYTPDKLETVYRNNQAKEEGTILHAFASVAINKRIKLANVKKALNMFVNDAIGYKMISEQVLFYSHNSFGTADAILFKDRLLRIHDLKTGITKPSFKQLDIYAALFCLEYEVDPTKIDIEERLYQGNGFMVNLPESLWIQEIMDKIVEFDVVLENLKQQIR
jgi:hypothetical protein